MGILPPYHKKDFISFLSIDDRYVIVKRKNANGSKTPPQYKSTTVKSTNGNRPSMRSPNSDYNNFREGESHDPISGMQQQAKKIYVLKIEKTNQLKELFNLLKVLFNSEQYYTSQKSQREKD